MEHLFCIDNYANKLPIINVLLWVRLIMAGTYDVHANVYVSLVSFQQLMNTGRQTKADSS